VDERLVGHAIDEGVDHIYVSDVGELVALLREALDELLEGLIGPLPVVVEVPRVPELGVRALEVPDEDGVEVSSAADAARLELLKPNRG
jgi:hypothetical protein